MNEENARPAWRGSASGLLCELHRRMSALARLNLTLPIRRLRKRGRVVECTGLENRHRGNPIVSSNLTASARNKRSPPREGFFCFCWQVKLESSRAVSSTHRQDSRCAQPSRLPEGRGTRMYRVISHRFRQKQKAHLEWAFCFCRVRHIGRTADVRDLPGCPAGEVHACPA
jgi:hypothetical protein